MSNILKNNKILTTATSLSLIIMASFAPYSYGSEEYQKNGKNDQNISCLDLAGIASHKRRTAPESIAATYLAYGTWTINYQELIKELEGGLARAKAHYREKEICNSKDKGAGKILQKAWVELWEKSIAKAKNAHKEDKDNELRLRDQALHMANNILAIFQASGELKEKVLKQYVSKPDLIRDMEAADTKITTHN